MNEKPRNELIDFLKGFLISLVVLGHCIQYGSGEDYLAKGLFYDNFLFKLIYSFHMPFFMAICGYLFYFSIQKHSIKSIILSKLKTIIVPIFSWNLLFQVVYYVYETHAFSPRDIFITWIVTSFSVHWFLWALFYCTITFLLFSILFKEKLSIT